MMWRDVCFVVLEHLAVGKVSCDPACQAASRQALATLFSSLYRSLQIAADLFTLM